MMTAVKSRRRVLIVDDHPLVRCGLCGVIADQSDLEVCGEAADDIQAMRQIDELSPDLVVVDLALGQASGLELIKRIRDRFPQVKMLVASMYDESLFAERCLRAGAQGYLNKQTALDEVVQAIQQVLAGSIYLSSQMTSRMLRSAVQHPAPPQGDPIHQLTDRELQVFKLLGHGLTTREVAQRLNLSVKTIETYRENLKIKLSASNSSELVRRAVLWVLENG